MVWHPSKSFLTGIVTALAFWPTALLTYFLLGMGETRSDAKPPAWETMLMRSAVRASVRRASPSLPSPPPATQQAIVAGGKLYLMGCTGCHGELGKPYAEEQAHYPPVPQLPHTGSQYSEAEIAWIIKHGIRMTGMSAYGPFYNDNQLWALAAFVRRINNLSPAELQAIQAKQP